MTELNQKSMQTPFEEEKKRSSQVEDIRKRVVDLELKSEQKKKLLDEITTELKEEKEKANKVISEITSEYSEIEDKNISELRNLKKNFETKCEEAKKQFEDEKTAKTTEKDKKRKHLDATKGKIFKQEAMSIKD